MERKLKTDLVVAGGPALLVNGPGRSCLSGLMMIRRESQAALIMRANGGHPNVKVVAEGAMTGEMMEDNAGRKKRSTQKIFTRDLAWFKTVLKRTTKSLQVMEEVDPEDLHQGPGVVQNGVKEDHKEPPSDGRGRPRRSSPGTWRGSKRC